MDKSSLPKFPRMPSRTCSSDLDGTIPVVSSSIALRESRDFASLIQDRSDGLPLVVSADSPIVRYHGCRSCPWYGSSQCFEKIVPPALHDRGICSGRLHEILDIAELHNSPDGLKIRKIETVERIRRHILLLEANLADYSLKRFELLNDLKSKPLTDSDGDPILSDAHPGWKAAAAERELRLKEFDGYQRSLQSQIQVLSSKFADLLREDEKLQDKKVGPRGAVQLNIQQLNVLWSDSAKRLQELESLKDKDVV